MKKDIGWISTFVGTSIGAGILFLPIQVGISGGFWIFLVSVIITAIIATFSQRYIGDVVALDSSGDTNKSFSDIIEDILGTYLGKIFVGIFFVMIFGLLIAYTTALSNCVSQELIKVHIHLSTTPTALILLIILVSVLMLPKRWFLRIIDKIVFFLIVAILIYSVILIPHWQGHMVSKFPSLHALIKGVLTVVPILITSAGFFTVTSAAVISFKEDGENVVKRTRRSVYIAMAIIIVFTSFFVISNILTIDLANMQFVYQHNLTLATAIDKQNLGKILFFFVLIITLLSIITSFFGVFFGAVETVKNIVGVRTEKNNARIERIIIIIIAILLFVIVACNINVLSIIGLIISPTLAIISYIIPVILIYRSDSYKSCRGGMAILILIIGIVLTFAYALGAGS